MELKKVAPVTRHLALRAALPIALSFTPLMTNIVDAQGQSVVTMAAGEEKEICSGVKSAVYMFALDLVTSLAKLIRPDVPALDDTRRILTAMVIAGGSAAVHNIMVGLGFRQARTPETVMPTPPANKGWISPVSFVVTRSRDR